MQAELEEAANLRQLEAGQAEGRQAGLKQALAAQEQRSSALASELASRPPLEEVRPCSGVGQRLLWWLEQAPE